MPPNTLREHTEFVLVKSVGPKVSWAESRMQGDWRIFHSPSVHCQNCGGGDRWCRHLSSLWEFFLAKSELKVNDRHVSQYEKCLVGDKQKYIVTFDEVRIYRNDYKRRSSIYYGARGEKMCPNLIPRTQKQS
ncbi:uncharacterized protein TNCV_1588011 [Trichonephila clavipes]|uniref:Uncharacterized protein n=1 Tax=Trichonephila clavipes TaxID=2585209 RepID=A0A8X6RJT5_TRICX|nr:uncharacterized protein TNCV_1588011 [Trichonephila clavipes]